MQAGIQSSRHKEAASLQAEAVGTIHVGIVRTAADIQQCLEIRHEVFVTEQRLFPDSDRDDYDDTAIHIAAVAYKRIVGTVRCYERHPGLWYGGRLAVLREFRTGRVGTLLVQKAVQTMRENPDVQRFLATIQIQNVRFFEKLGWWSLGPPRLLNGRKHQLMEIGVRS
jgi:putative N-acetyltransferase (TIGR04045 family)